MKHFDKLYLAVPDLSAHVFCEAGKTLERIVLQGRNTDGQTQNCRSGDPLYHWIARLLPAGAFLAGIHPLEHGGDRRNLLFLLYQIDARFSRRTLFWRCFAGALAVTAVEFAVGCVVNLALGWGVWDYSRMPMQLWGQICLPFFLLWFLLCIPVLGVTGMLRCSLFRKEEGRAP